MISRFIADRRMWHSFIRRRCAWPPSNLLDSPQLCGCHSSLFFVLHANSKEPPPPHPTLGNHWPNQNYNVLYQGFPLIQKRIFLNISEYFRIRAGPANSEYSEYIRIFPNMRRVSIRGLGGYGEGLLCCGGCTLGMVHTRSPQFFSSVNTSMPVPTPDEFPSEQATASTIG